MNEVKLKDLIVLFCTGSFCCSNYFKFCQNFCVRRMTDPVFIISGQNIVKILAIDLCYHITITGSGINVCAKSLKYYELNVLNNIYVALHTEIEFNISVLLVHELYVL